MNKFKNCYEIINVFLLSMGAVVGVGFLSGAEIWAYFARFGENLWFEILLCFALLFVVIFKMLCLAEKEKTGKMLNFQKITQKNTNYTKLKIKKVFSLVEVLLCSAAMFAGLKNIVWELFFKNQILIFLLAVFFIFIVLIFGFKAISKFNFVIIFGFFLVMFFIMAQMNFASKETYGFLKIIQPASLQGVLASSAVALLYVFMNMVHLMQVFKTSDLVLSKKSKTIFAVALSATFCLLILMLSLFLSKNSHLTGDVMPLLTFFQNAGSGLKVFFVIVLLGGLLSTLLVCLQGLKRQIESRVKGKLAASFWAVFLSLLLGFLPFKFFINFVYPVVAVLNLIALLFL